MPQYEFLCTACKKTFSTKLTLAEYEKAKIAGLFPSNYSLLWPR